MDEAEKARVEAAFEGWAARAQPINEVPATLVLDRVIAAGENFIVFVSTLSVFSTGIGFFTEVRGQGGPSGEGLPVTTLSDALFGSAPEEQRMLLGVEYADGRRGVRTPRGEDVGPGEGDDIRLISEAGRGFTNNASAWWFLSPPPPPGDLHLYCAWPALGIPETCTVIGGDDLEAAKQRVQRLWSAPQFFTPNPSTSPVSLPGSGWFATGR
jgi:hypothetical protein